MDHISKYMHWYNMLQMQFCLQLYWQFNGQEDVTDLKSLQHFTGAGQIKKIPVFRVTQP